MKKQDFSKLNTYEVVLEEELSDIASIGTLLKHKRTGARVLLINNNDDNKVFYIGFRTTPKDSTGVMHILEHSVLCGSEEFPVKDPFIELAKGSLNTFLNAMTYPDKTVYPVASTNDKDFQNLMHVYLDAVFYPNILKTNLTFKQEGWHYEMENADDELTINGVVYNEMKGAFSSPDDVLERTIFNSLFPNTTYGNESGGDPKCIPNLTYENYINTYKKYYHPSNSYIYLYGDMDMIEKLEFIDEKYLSKFDRIEVDSEVKSQEAFKEPREMKTAYSITESEPLQNNTYLSYNVAMDNNLDPEEYIALQVVDYALCSAPGAPLKQTMLDRNIGKDIYSFYDNGVKQPYFSIVAKNSDEDKKQEFLSTIEEVLNRIIKEGYNKDSLLAALNVFEFKFREADFGSYPPGLMYGLQAFDSWLYDEMKPFIHIAAGNTFKKLREKLDKGYFEELTRTRILENLHRTVVTVVPEVGLAQKEEKELAEKLAAYKSTLSKEEIDEIVRQSAELKEFQEAEDSPEDLCRIPVLELSDIKKEAMPMCNDERHIGDCVSLYHGIDTHGIDYIRLIFSADDIPAELMPYLGVLKNVMGLVDTKNYTYGELFNKINICTGGIAPVCNIFSNAKKLEEIKITFEWKAKVLKGSLKNAFELIEEMISTSVLDNDKRNKELFSEMKSRAMDTMMGSGHQVAIGRLGTYFSKGAAITDTISGMGNYRLVEKIEGDFENNQAELAGKLKALCKILFTRDNLMFDFAGDEDEYNEFVVLAKEFLSRRPAKKTVEEELLKDGAIASLDKYEPVICKKNEGLMSSSQVNYVCRGGNFIEKGLKYNGCLRVLKVIMSYDYLWMNVRVKNGAYGCMNAFGKTGDSFFVSYRDPNLAKTVDVFEGVPEYVKEFDADEREMTQYIIGTISELDTPLTPAAKALRSLSVYQTKLEYEDMQKERDEILSCDVASIRNLEKYMRAILENGYICVVGNEEAIKQEKERFTTLENLFLN